MVFFDAGGRSLLTVKPGLAVASPGLFFDRPASTRSFGLSTTAPKPVGSATVFWVVAVAISVLGLCYASVPLYQLYCQTVGSAGAARNVATVKDAGWAVKDSPPKTQLTIYFNANCPGGGAVEGGHPASQFPWSFKPTVQKIALYPGDTALTFFVVSNMAKEAKSGIFTYHIGPPKAGIYFNKIQCFCFEEQRLKAGETIEMPVLFYIDPDFEKDPKMKDVDSITLAYVLMETEKGLS